MKKKTPDTTPTPDLPVGYAEKITALGDVALVDIYLRYWPRTLASPRQDGRVVRGLVNQGYVVCPVNEETGRLDLKHARINGERGEAAVYLAACRYRAYGGVGATPLACGTPRRRGRGAA